MALGEWVPVMSARELAARETRIEAAKVLSPNEADTMVRRLLADRATAIDALAREELGIDPKDLGGSPWEAAVASFVLFAIGAVVPILPFVVMRGNIAVASSVAVSGLALYGIGGAITVFTGKPAWQSGGRQL